MRNPQTQIGVFGCGLVKGPAPRLYGAGNDGPWCGIWPPGPGISSPWRPPAPARRPLLCGSQPNCWPSGTVEQITVVVPTDTSRCSGRGGGRRRYRAGPQVRNSARRPPRVPRRSRHLCPGGQPPDPSPGAHREPQDAVVFDEIHHGGDAKTWGEGIREAFGDATRRLALTGTPFRSDDSAIPFVTYERGPDGLERSQADHSYGYADALADGVVRPVVFLAYSGESRWRDSAGEEYAARLGEPLTAEHTARAWRTALNPAGDWMPAVIAAADTRLQQSASTCRTRRDDHRLRPDGGPGLRRTADDHHRRGAGGGAVRRSGFLGPDHRFRPRHEPLAGRGTDGLRGRRRAAAGRRRVRHQRVDAAVFRTGDRPVRPVSAAPAKPRAFPAVGAGAAAAGQRNGSAAQSRARASRTGNPRGWDDESAEGAAKASPNRANWTTASRCWAPTPNWIR